MPTRQEVKAPRQNIFVAGKAGPPKNGGVGVSAHKENAAALAATPVHSNLSLIPERGKCKTFTAVQETGFCRYATAATTVLFE